MTKNLGGFNLGILGGSFNPVHVGHVRMAVEVLEHLGLDRVDLCPAARPPHKAGAGLLPFAERLRLTALAVEGIPGLAANGIEAERPGPSYTCETLAEYARREPGALLSFILGSGTLFELPNWRRGPELFELASFVVVNRWELDLEAVDRLVAASWPGARREAAGRWLFPSGNILTCLDVPRLDIKGADIRERWRRGRNLALLVPPGVQRALEADGPIYEAAWGRRGGSAD